MPITIIRNFLRLESASGIILLSVALIALVLENSPLSHFYQTILRTPFEIQVAQFVIAKPLLFWVNDCLMSIFFLVIGLELKREFIEGELSDTSSIVLPAVAAFGGMLVPALIYTVFNYQHPIAAKGWAIPVATDIAFSLGILSLFGKRVPISLKLFLMALAIFDDIGAIIIIAIFHSHTLSYFFLSMSAFIVFILYLLNRMGTRRLTPYILCGMLLWFFILKSGVHATIAGVILALSIPIQGKNDKNKPLVILEHALHPWVAYFVMPLFAFANVGLSFDEIHLSIFTESIPLGIILGLFLGKQFGVLSFSWVTIKMGWAKLPRAVSWFALYGVSLLCGIGFTMSLFLGTLAFQGQGSDYLIQVRFSVLIASLLSGVCGAIVLYANFTKKNFTRSKRVESS